jgi:predicted nucleic acid-binding protein
LIYCLDTDILIEHFRGNEEIKGRIESLTPDDKLGLVWLTVYEFFKGIFVSGKYEEEKFLQKLAESCFILEPTYEAARIGGEIYASLRKAGKLINDADILIASVVKANNAILVTNNEDHFSRIEGLKTENWLQ